MVAVVAATGRDKARAAAERVRVEYEPLPAVMTFMEAAAEGAFPIHENTPNIYMEQPVYKGEDTQGLLEHAAHTVEGSFGTSRQPHLTVEPDVVLAYPQDGGVVIQCKGQYLYGNIAQMAPAIGLPKEKVRIIGNPAGGSFGYSMSPGNTALAAACALALDAPVSLVLSYAEHQHTTGKRSPVYANVRLACDEAGKLTAMDFLAGIDHGAYSEMAGALTTKVCRFFGYPYAIPNIRGLVRTAFTNNNFGTAFRAFGSPQTYTASEQIVDMLAGRIGMDPFEFRYINVAREGGYLHHVRPLPGISHAGDDGHAAPALPGRPWKRPGRKARPEHRRGVGIAWGGYHVSKVPDRAEIDLELNQDGSVTHYSTWADVGQGADTGSLIHVHEALRPLRLRPEAIRLVRNDTGCCPDTGSASAAVRTMVVGHGYAGRGFQAARRHAQGRRDVSHMAGNARCGRSDQIPWRPYRRMVGH